MDDSEALDREAAATRLSEMLVDPDNEFDAWERGVLLAAIDFLRQSSPRGVGDPAMDRADPNRGEEAERRGASEPTPLARRAHEIEDEPGEPTEDPDVLAALLEADDSDAEGEA